MKRSSYIGLVGALTLSGLFLTTPATRARSNNCRHVNGHIDGNVAGFTESGFFFDSDGNTLGYFDAYVTGLEFEGEGAQKLQLAHTYTTNGGDKFTTADDIVLSPIDPPVYRVNNRAIVTGGTGTYQDAFGFINDHGTYNQDTGVVSVDYYGQICTP
jgi:hypothetical protein